MPVEDIDNVDKCRQFIENSLADGLNPHKIRPILRKEGYSDDAIDEALKYVVHPHVVRGRLKKPHKYSDRKFEDMFVRSVIYVFKNFMFSLFIVLFLLGIHGLIVEPDRMNSWIEFLFILFQIFSFGVILNVFVAAASAFNTRISKPNNWNKSFLIGFVLASSVLFFGLSLGWALLVLGVLIVLFTIVFYNFKIQECLALYVILILATWSFKMLSMILIV